MTDQLWLCLAIYRITRIITRETGPLNVFSNWRQYLGQQASIQDKYTPARQSLAELFDCPHCLGVWIAALVYILRKPLKPLWIIFAYAGVQSLIQSFDDRMNEE